jgi:hypothetical protein
MFCRIVACSAVLGATLMTAGCVTEASEAELAGPVVDVDRLGPKAATESLDGWSITAGWDSSTGGGFYTGKVTFQRTSGASTRGGGACLIQSTGESCSVDSDCPGAPSGGYAGGYVYCAQPNGATQKTCWVRPGAPSSYCVQSPSNSPGVKITPSTVGVGVAWAVLACLADDTMPAGCGSTDPANYVRAVSNAVIFSFP